VRARRGHPAPGSLLATDGRGRGRLLGSDPEHLVILADVPRPTTATVATGWSPNRHATLDRRVVPHSLSADGMVAVSLPTGASTVRLEFRPDRWDHLGAAATLLTLAGGLALAGQRWRRPAAKPGPAPPAD
jgi:hypothetical protein